MTNKKYINKIAKDIRKADEFSIWSIYRADGKKMSFVESLRLAKEIVRCGKGLYVESENLFGYGGGGFQFSEKVDVLNSTSETDTYDDGDIRHNSYCSFMFEGVEYDYYYSL